MSSPPQTYFPAQYLEAGYHAEMAGERERAAQYYHYLAESFADTPEGDAARAGLARLGYTFRAQPQRSGSSSPHASASADVGADTHRAAPDASGHGQYQQAGLPQATGHGQQHQPEHAQAQSASFRAPSYPQSPQAQQRERATGSRIRLGELSNQNLATRPQPAQTEANPAGQPAQHSVRGADRPHGAGEEGLRLPEVVARRAREMADLDDDLHFEKQYRGARFLAHLLTWMGWVAAAGGLALLVLGFVGIPPSLTGAIIGLPGGVVVGFSVCITGLALALGGQMALATFDQAQAMREIGIILRARADI